jgi:zinc protease
MKPIFLTFILLFAFVITVPAQVDRSKAPAPAPAREIKIGEYQTFTLKNGLQVFVVENHKLPRVQFSLRLKQEAVREGDKAGYTDIAGTLISTGTKTRTKAQLDEEVDFIGANLSTGSTGIYASSLTKHKGKLLELFSDVLLNPSFQQSELDKLKTQTISGITAGKENPNTISSNVRSVLLYGKDHPYGEISTEKSVESITIDDCRNYYNAYFKPNNAYLVIVGDISFKEAKSITSKYFGKWAKGEVKYDKFDLPTAPEKTFVALVDRPNSVQSVISIAYPLEFHPSNPDAIKARVLNQILGGSSSARLYMNLRETKGYTYGAYSSLNTNPLVGSFYAGASVRNEVTDSAVYEIMHELRRIAAESVTDEELAEAKASIAGSFGRSLESPQTVANFALNTVRYNLPKDYYANYVKSVDAVARVDVLGVARKYIKPDNACILVVGKGEEIADKLKGFGELKYYDIEGNPYTPSAGSALPPGLTAEKVISTYIEAIGGAQKIGSVQSTKIVMKGSAMGTELTLTTIRKTGGKSLIEVEAGGMVMQKVVSDGKDLSVTMMGQKAPVEGGLKELQIFEGSMFREVAYKELGAKAELKGVQSIDGKEAFAVEYILPQGEKLTELYDRETGLKVQTVQVVKGPQGEVSVTVKYSDYKAVDGIKLPHTILQSQGQMNLKFEATSVEVNLPVDDAVFKVD